MKRPSLSRLARVLLSLSVIPALYPPRAGAQQPAAVPAPEGPTVEGCILDTLESLNSQGLRLGEKCVPERASGPEGKTGGPQVIQAQREARDILQRSKDPYRHRSRQAKFTNSCSGDDFFRDCTVRLLRDGAVVAQTQSDENGYFLIPVPSTVISGTVLELCTEADGCNFRREIFFTDSRRQYKIDLPLESRPVSLLTRAIVGYDQSGASSIKADQRYFFDVFVTVPFPWGRVTGKCDPETGHGCIDPDFGPRNRIWADAQISSVPQAGTATVASLATGAGFAGQVGNLQAGQVAQSVQFLVGGEIRLPLTFRTLLPSFDRNTKQKFSISFIGSFGAITPTKPDDSVQIFKYDPNAGLPPAPAGTQYVAFVPNTRDRFFRQYYGGFRLQTFFFNRYERPLQRFPGIFDVTYGQNEFITGGHFRGGMFRFDGYWPLPYEALKYINLFGTFFLRPTREHDTTPIILEAAPAGIPFPATNIAQLPAPTIRRDYYRIGVGIDFVSFTQFLASAISKK